MATDQELFDAMVETVQKHYPKFKVIPKKSSWRHRFIGKFLKAFRVNTTYMEDFWTTIGNEAAWDLDDKPGEHYSQDWVIIPHEGNHTGQKTRYSMFFYGMLYLLGTPLTLLPGLLIGLPLIIAGAVTATFPWWIGLIVIGAAALLALPVPFGLFRGYWELTAYRFSVAIRWWRGDTVGPDYYEWSTKNFTSSNYFWMLPFGKYVKKKLLEGQHHAQSGKIFDDPKYGNYYKDIYLALKNNGVVKRPASKEPTA